MSSERILVAMSGGVDSSVAAALLVEQGHEVIGVTMKLFCYDDGLSNRPCCSIDSIRDAEAVAERLQIPHYVLDLADSFEHNVIRNFVSEYERGHTPIPCVRCNSFIKFKDLLSYADDLDCGRVATGHYAIAREGALYRGKDQQKDQTYFLWDIEKTTIKRLLLPLGELTKVETRDIARQHGFETAEKPESVEICFVPDDNYVAVLEQRLADDSPALSRGTIVGKTGEVVGEHNGFARFTIGQRKRLPGGFSEAMYVTKILPEDRRVVIGTDADLYGTSLSLADLNWLSTPLEVGDKCLVSTRYRSSLVEASVKHGDNRILTLELKTPVRAITPGQSGVLFDNNERLLGGGVIQ